MKIYLTNLKSMILLGIPFQIIIGSKSSKDLFEFKEVNSDTKMLNLNQIIKQIKN